MPSGAAVRRREAGAAGPDPQRRRAALEAARQRYGGLSTAGKRQLLDELQGITGYRQDLAGAADRPDPQRYGEQHLRTLQRRLRGYRLQWIEQEMTAAAIAPIPEMQGSKTGEMSVLPGVN